MSDQYGVTPQGFVRKPLPVIATEVDGDLKGIVGESAGTEPDGTIPPETQAGQLKTLLVDRETAIWEKIQAVYSSWDTDQNTDAAQDATAAITNTFRDGSLFSKAPLVCAGVPGTQLKPGRVVKVQVSGSPFASQGSAPAVIAALAAWAQSTNYVAGDRRTANGNAYLCITSGLSAAVGTGPAGTGLNIVDAAAHWAYIGTGTGAVDVPFSAQQAGPIGALARTLTQIGTPVSGWNTAINLADALVGATREGNAHFRVRRVQELEANGRTTRDAIRAKILKVNEGSTDPAHQPPASVRVLMNDTDLIDGNGLLPHSVEIIVQDGTDQDIVQAIWDVVGAGTRTQGTNNGVAIDSEKNPQTVYYTRPTPKPVWIAASVEYDPTKWPAVGAPALVSAYAKSAILTSVEGFIMGVSVRATPLAAAVLDEPSQIDNAGNPVVPADPGAPPAPGLVDASPFFIGLAPAPGTSATIPIAIRELATFDSARIAITPVATVP